MTLAVNLSNLANYVNAAGKLDAQNGLFNATFGIIEPFTTLTASSGSLTIDASAGPTLFYVNNLSGTTALTINNIISLLPNNSFGTSIVVVSAQTGVANFISSIVLAGATTVTLRWASGLVPIQGSASGTFDLYQINILRTANGVYSVLVTKIGF